MDDFESKKILVTGGLGFVGSNLSLRLKDLNCKVTIADKELKNSFRLAPYEKHFTIKRCDLTDYDQIHKIVGGYDIVFHLAAQTSHAFSMKNPQLDADINVRGTLNLLEALRNNNENAKFVFSSTKGVSGTPSSLPVNEETPTNPLDVYSANKLLAEEYCKIYNNHFDIDFSILRLTNIFGPRQQITSPSLGILNFFIGRAMKDEIITIYGEGNQLRDYNYIENAIDALLLCAIKEEAKNEIFYLGSNIGTKFKDMATLIVNVVGKGKVEYIPYPPDAKKIEIGDFVVDFSKLEKLLEWKPKIPFREGIEKTVDFYNNHPEYFSK